MEIGCGARVRDFDGRRYWYFWHYERVDGRSVRREDYVGRVDSRVARDRLLGKMVGYHRRAEQEFARRRARVEPLILGDHTSTWMYAELAPAPSAERVSAAFRASSS